MSLNVVNVGAVQHTEKSERGCFPSSDLDRARLEWASLPGTAISTSNLLMRMMCTVQEGIKKSPFRARLPAICCSGPSGQTWSEFSQCFCSSAACRRRQTNRSEDIAASGRPRAKRFRVAGAPPRDLVRRFRIRALGKVSAWRGSRRPTPDPSADLARRALDRARPLPQAPAPASHSCHAAGSL